MSGDGSVESVNGSKAEDELDDDFEDFEEDDELDDEDVDAEEDSDEDEDDRYDEYEQYYGGGDEEPIRRHSEAGVGVGFSVVGDGVTA